MALTTEKQFMESAMAANHILVTFRKEWTPDAVASALALARVLEKKGKKVDIAADGFTLPKSLAFLPDATRIQPALRQLRKFTIALDISKTKIDELSYEVAGDKLHIHIMPKEGAFAPSDVSSEHSDFKYDLIIALDTQEYGGLGAMFTDHAEFFYGKPVVNIDHEPSNERYGNMNLVDVTATSCCEAVYGLCAASGEHFLDAETATCLLTGIISKTHSFKTSSVTPRTLDIASELVAAGARRDDIITNLYRTRSIATLKLWGRALARIKFDPETKTAWSVLVRQDFIHAGATEEHLSDVIGELMMNSPEAHIVSLIYEQDAKDAPGGVASICALVSSESHGNVAGMFTALKPEGDRKTARLCFPETSILDAERQVLTAIRVALGKVPATAAA